MGHAGDRLIPGVTGSAVFLAVQMLLFRVTAPIPDIADSGWFLNSGRGVLVVGLAMVGLGAVLGFSRGGVKKATLSALGATLAMAVTLFTIGPGNLFPIVIVFGSVIVGASVAVGATAGVTARRILELRRGSSPRLNGRKDR